MLYDYRCKKCGATSEVCTNASGEIKFFDEEKCKITESGNIMCTKCKVLMEKDFSVTNFILKGDCWSKDGYTRGNGSSKKTVK